LHHGLITKLLADAARRNDLAEEPRQQPGPARISRGAGPFAFFHRKI